MLMHAKGVLPNWIKFSCNRHNFSCSINWVYLRLTCVIKMVRKSPFKNSKDSWTVGLLKRITFLVCSGNLYNSEVCCLNALLFFFYLGARWINKWMSTWKKSVKRKCLCYVFLHKLSSYFFSMLMSQWAKIDKRVFVTLHPKYISHAPIFVRGKWKWKKRE